MPKPSLSSTCTTGARQFVVQLALEMMWCLAASYLSSLTPNNNRYVVALCRGGNNDLFCTGIEMTLRLRRLREESGRFDHDVHAEFLPGKGRRDLP